MNIKYNNSLFSSMPPKTLITIPKTFDEYMEEVIDEHNFEESYDLDNVVLNEELETTYFKELIKHEPNCKKGKCFCREL